MKEIAVILGLSVKTVEAHKFNLMRKLDVSRFREQHWEGSFWEYLDIVMDNPAVARNAFQRVYDMILSHGSEPFVQFKQDLTRYKFFSDPLEHGADAIYGLERPLMQLVDFLKSAAQDCFRRRIDR